MKITQIVTEDAEFFEGVGTLPITITSQAHKPGKTVKYPTLTFDIVEPGVGVKLSIPGRGSLIIPWNRIRSANVSE